MQYYKTFQVLDLAIDSFICKNRFCPCNLWQNIISTYNLNLFTLYKNTYINRQFLKVP